MQKFINFIIGALVAAVMFFFVFDSGSMRVSLPVWLSLLFVNPLGYVVLAAIIICLFFIAKRFNNPIFSRVSDILIYAMLVFVLLLLFFPRYIFF